MRSSGNLPDSFQLGTVPSVSFRSDKPCLLTAKVENGWLCKECGRVFNSKSGAYIHVRQEHLKTHRYLCEICSEGFMMKANYEGHMNSHKSIRAFKCQHCSKSYFYSGDLQRHLRVKKCGSTTSHHWNWDQTHIAVTIMCGDGDRLLWSHYSWGWDTLSSWTTFYIGTMRSLQEYLRTSQLV